VNLVSIIPQKEFSNVCLTLTSHTEQRPLESTFTMNLSSYVEQWLAVLSVMNSDSMSLNVLGAMQRSDWLKYPRRNTQPFQTFQTVPDYGSPR
jgi:hypothetical protein